MIGNEILQAYFREASKFPEFRFPSYPAWTAFLLSRRPDFISELGNFVNSMDVNAVARAKARVAALANETGGKASATDIVRTLKNSSGMSGGMGVSLNPMDWFTSQDTLDVEHGDQVLQAYFDSAAMFLDFPYGDYDSFRAALGGDEYVKGLGANVRAHAHPGAFDLIYFPYDDAAKRVADLATQTEGRASGADINQAAIDKSVDIVAAISQAGTQVIANTATGAEGVSKLLKYAPFVLLGGAALYIFIIAKGHSRALGGK